MQSDIIAAIATANGHGAIGIVRMSGAGVLALISRVFTHKGKMESHRMYYGNIVCGGQIIDEVMVCPMLAPRSYTMEDTVEVYAHGGMVVLRSVLEAMLQEGARLAQPGEFTKRAFLNGRINLTQAEAVMDIIRAGSDAARRAGLAQLGGGLSNRIVSVRNVLLSWLAHIELSIDYPEHEEEAKTAAQILTEGDALLAQLDALLQTAAVGRMLRDGIKTAIVGRPNAGKSTLLNAILSEDRAIVHHQPGTTRDVLTERVVVGDIPLVIMDTAGIRNTTNQVEAMGVKKSIEAAQDAELILYVIDASQGTKLHSTDADMLQQFDGKNVIVLLNKNDLPSNITVPGALSLSTSSGSGMSELYNAIVRHAYSGAAAPGETEIVTRERHRSLLAQAHAHVKDALQDIRNHVPEDLVSVKLRAAYITLGEILGLEVADDILDRIFAEFCVGK